MIWLYIIIGIIVVLCFLILASLYTIVPADYADVVVQGKKMTIFSSHPEYSKEGKSAYFKIPSWFFILKLGMIVHRIPLKIITINVPNFLAFDKDRARFLCDIICYVTVKDPVSATKRFSGNIEEMKSQISIIVQATTRDVTTKKPIREIINNRDDIIKTISPLLADTISHWGLNLNDMELIDFKDPSPKTDGITSQVIDNISTIIETQINSEMRQKNAEQIKIARVKEAEADELSRQREIARDETVQKRDQNRMKEVAIQSKEAKEKEYDVIRVKQVRQAEIDKEQALVEANKRKDVEAINKEQKRLEGEGDKTKLMEQAKGNAEATRQEGLASADAKEALQAALNKFKDEAIRALIAEKVVDKDKAIGVETAKALLQANLNVFAGGEDGKAGFNLAQLIGAAKATGDANTVEALLNRIARPNDIGVNLFGKEDRKIEEKLKVVKLQESINNLSVEDRKLLLKKLEIFGEEKK